jgi:hypothetical protein
LRLFPTIPSFQSKESKPLRGITDFAGVGVQRFFSFIQGPFDRLSISWTGVSLLSRISKKEEEAYGETSTRKKGRR